MKRKQISIIGIVVVLIISVISYFNINNHLNRVTKNQIKFYEFKIDKLPKGWSLIAKENSVIGWLYKLNGSSITIKKASNISEEKLSDQVYSKSLINQYINKNNKIS